MQPRVPARKDSDATDSFFKTVEEQRPYVDTAHNTNASYDCIQTLMTIGVCNSTVSYCVIHTKPLHDLIAVVHINLGDAWQPGNSRYVPPVYNSSGFDGCEHLTIINKMQMKDNVFVDDASRSVHTIRKSAHSCSAGCRDGIDELEERIAAGPTMVCICIHLPSGVKKGDGPGIDGGQDVEDGG